MSNRKGKTTVGIAYADGTWRKYTFETTCSAEELVNPEALKQEAKACLHLGNQVVFAAMLAYQLFPDDPLNDYEPPFAVNGWFDDMSDPDAAPQAHLKVVDINEHEVCRIMHLTTRQDAAINKRQYALATKIAKLLTTSVKEDQ